MSEGLQNGQPEFEVFPTDGEVRIEGTANELVKGWPTSKFNCARYENCTFEITVTPTTPRVYAGPIIYKGNQGGVDAFLESLEIEVDASQSGSASVVIKGSPSNVVHKWDDHYSGPEYGDTAFMIKVFGDRAQKLDVIWEGPGHLADKFIAYIKCEFGIGVPQYNVSIEGNVFECIDFWKTRLSALSYLGCLVTIIAYATPGVCSVAQIWQGPWAKVQEFIDKLEEQLQSTAKERIASSFDKMMIEPRSIVRMVGHRHELHKLMGEEFTKPEFGRFDFHLIVLDDPDVMSGTNQDIAQIIGVSLNQLRKLGQADVLAEFAKWLASKGQHAEQDPTQGNVSSDNHVLSAWTSLELLDVLISRFDPHLDRYKLSLAKGIRHAIQTLS